MTVSHPLIKISRKQALIFATFLVIYEFLTYIANDMIMPGMLKVVETFHASDSAIARSLMFYILGGSTLQIILGPLSDKYGRKPIMIAGAWLFLAFTVLIACSLTIHQFLAARFFQGMGLCFITVVGYATLHETFEEMEVVRLVAIMANVSIMAPLLGPLLGALFVSYWDWRIMFIVIAVLAVITLWGLWRFMPESVGVERRDGSMVTPVELSAREIKARYIALLKNKKFMFASLCSGLLGLPCVAWIGLSPLIIVAETGDSMLTYGLWQIPVFFAAIVGNMLLHRLTHHFKLNQLILMGSITMVSGLFVMFASASIWTRSFVSLMPGLIIYFLGIGLAGSPLARLTLYATEITKGTASAVMGLILMALQAVGIEIINVLYEAHRSNFVFAGYCAGVGLIYLITMSGIFSMLRHEKNTMPHTS